MANRLLGMDSRPEQVVRCWMCCMDQNCSAQEVTCHLPLAGGNAATTLVGRNRTECGSSASRRLLGSFHSTSFLPQPRSILIISIHQRPALSCLQHCNPFGYFLSMAMAMASTFQAVKQLVKSLAVIATNATRLFKSDQISPADSDLNRKLLKTVISHQQNQFSQKNSKINNQIDWLLTPQLVRSSASSLCVQCGSCQFGEWPLRVRLALQSPAVTALPSIRSEIRKVAVIGFSVRLAARVGSNFYF